MTPEQDPDTLTLTDSVGPYFVSRDERGNIHFSDGGDTTTIDAKDVPELIRWLSEKPQERMTASEVRKSQGYSEKPDPEVAMLSSRVSRLEQQANERYGTPSLRRIIEDALRERGLKGSVTFRQYPIGTPTDIEFAVHLTDYDWMVRDLIDLNDPDLTTILRHLDKGAWRQ